MNTTVKALQNLYVALGGELSDVADCTTNVEMLNAIAAKYDGADDAVLNPDAIDNIAEIADSIGGTTPIGTKIISENGTHDVSEFAEVNVQVGGSSDFTTATVTVTVPVQGDFALLGAFIEDLGGGHNATVPGYTLSNSTSDPASGSGTLVLYNGNAVVLVDVEPSTYAFTVSGNATIHPQFPDQVLVTGDCTIAITEK